VESELGWLSYYPLAVNSLSPRLVLLALTAVGASACLASNTSSTDDPRAFFKGKTMTYIVPTTPGGGYDTYARLVADFVQRRLAMRRVLVKNVPGSGHIIGANEIYEARADGLTLGTFSPGIIYAQLLRVGTLRADLRRMSWIGQPSEEPQVLVVSAKSGFRSFADLQRAGRPLLLGVSDRGSRTYYDAALLTHALGLPTKMVFGLTTTGAQVSMMRGEIELRLNSVSSTRAFVAGGYGHPVARVGNAEAGDDRVPEAGDFVTTDEGRRAVDFVRSLTAFAHWTVGPPGIAEGRLRLLRETYLEAMNDPALLEAARRMAIPIGPVRNGERLAKEVHDSLDQPADFVAFVTSVTGFGE
jgi:tripartite-type tricarboxylate transporter receptor subunit TctC